MTVRDIYDFLNTYCPYELAADWDNPGLNVGHFDREVTKVLLAMDATEGAIKAAEGCQLLITHHPLIFSPEKQVNSETATGRHILSLAERGIAHIACHTNLDAAEGGVNTCLAACCGMEQAELFCGIGRMGAVETTLTALAERLKKELPAQICLGVKAHEAVHTVAVVGGSGGSLLEDAARLGCDTFVTGEAKYSHYLLAKELGINLLVLGHYETEYIALPPLAAALKKQFPALEVCVLPYQSPMESL
ncbi:MAG: Nif3-like dinuclear metal center hexameric protein [Clostridia bacterium]|nr:Nif3-like dinuclear metal center hexameric protein [Clostridia bacterium]MBQ8893222.1 Nif3-like dinuclear metal center hexameric protein [Clostridia bacterium]